jgi:GT2 family glycosyltransferase/predicted SAM-dependent methyltransferase
MSRPLVLNVACGDGALPGFINLDRRPGGDLRLDPTMSLPFRASSVDGIYCAGFVEHLDPAEASAFLRDCRRVLRPGGVLRVATLDLDALVRHYLSPGWRDAERGRGGAWLPATRCEMLNLALRARGHRWVYNEEDLVRRARLAGLRPGRRWEPGASDTPAFRGLEDGGGPPLVMEFIKDRAPDPDPAPLVSILMPVFKARHFRAALESALAQTWRPLEVVIGDDSPDDAIARIVSDTSPGDVRLVYHRNPRPLGELDNSRQTLARARGAYVKILHDDDLLLPACVARQVAVLRDQPDVTLVTSHRALIDGEGRALPDDDATRRPVPCDARIDGEAAANTVLARLCNFIGEPSVTMFRRRDVPDDLWSFAGRGAHANTDVALWLSLLSQGDLVYLTDTLCLYRRHPAQQQRAPDFLRVAAGAWAQFRADGERLGFLRGQGPWPFIWRPFRNVQPPTARLDAVPAGALERLAWTVKRLQARLAQDDPVAAWRLAAHALDLLRRVRDESPDVAEEAATMEAVLGELLDAVVASAPAAVRRQMSVPSAAKPAAWDGPDAEAAVPAPGDPARDAGEADTTIVVRARWGPAVLRRCLAGIAAAGFQGVAEVLVAPVGGPNEATDELRAASEAAGARWLAPTASAAGAAALNAAARTARGRFLVFLHDDVVPRPGWLQALRAAAADPGVGAVGARLLYPDAPLIQHAGLAFAPTRNPYPLYRGWNADHPAVNRPRALRAVSGACLLVRREQFLAVGGFDEGYAESLEDVDLCLRYGRAGLRVVYAPGAVLEHADREAGNAGPVQSAVRADFRRLLERWGHGLAADGPAYHAEDGFTFALHDGAVQIQMEPGAVYTSVVMVTYNSALDLPGCLRTLLDLEVTGEPVELVVVDNNSTDATRALLDRLRASRPHVVVIHNDDNRGFARAVNQGLRAASGQWIVLLNPDTRLTRGWLGRLRAHAGPGVGAVGPVSNGAGGAQHVRRWLPDWDGEPEAETAARLAAAHAGRAARAAALTFFCTLIPRAVFDRVGLLDEDFFLNQEDLEFCLRLRLAGYYLVVAGDAYIHHLGGGSKLSLDPVRQLALHSEATQVLLQKLAARFGGAMPPLESLWGDDVVGGERLSSAR